VEQSHGTAVLNWKLYCRGRNTIVSSFQVPNDNIIFVREAGARCVVRFDVRCLSMFVDVRRSFLSTIIPVADRLFIPTNFQIKNRNIVIAVSYIPLRVITWRLPNNDRIE